MTNVMVSSYGHYCTVRDEFCGGDDTYRVVVGDNGTPWLLSLSGEVWGPVVREYTTFTDVLPSCREAGDMVKDESGYTWVVLPDNILARTDLLCFAKMSEDGMTRSFHRGSIDAAQEALNAAVRLL